MPGDLLRVDDRSPADIHRILAAAADLRNDFISRQLEPALEGVRLAAIWDGEGFRNRAAFDLGVRLLGGNLVEVPERLGRREPLQDLGGYLDNWFDGLIIRTPRFDLMRELAELMKAPVVNARTSVNHPCEILGDLAFVIHERGHIEGLHVVFIGPATNLLGSWLEAASALPIQLTQVCPQGYEYSEQWIPSRDRVTVRRDLACVASADIIYTDAWPSRTDANRSSVINGFGPLRVTCPVLDSAPAGCVFLPCPPVTRGEEVDAASMEHPKCAVPRAKEWLMHAQNAVLVEMFGREAEAT